MAYRVEFLIADGKDSNGRKLSKFALQWLKEFSERSFHSGYAVSSTLKDISQTGYLHTILIRVETNEVIYFGNIDDLRDHLFNLWWQKDSTDD